ncbi:restriction endonuclease [Jejuia pallidilutea]|uniref:Restriction endonuclease n=1 Tax=Jejuia pallidilutea TaxID=504487 RepID=A0A362WYW5_9FLAO|nr:restriction endonuclease [Jejuia pallidilutea]PQV47406.1 restriction endonuclease [Jejuia pallidilutea]
MSNYNFKTLNDKEFENLTRDLLSAEMEIEFQSFKSGRDKGIDLRYSTTRDNKIVVQIKHYANSTFAQLKHTLSNTELPKIKKLKPERYIVATSLELSPQETEEIKEILSPFVLSLNDIYWNQRINALLSKFQDIERNHFKLWFSSSSILTNILNNSSYLKSAYLETELENKISHYVKTDFHDKATEILKTQKVLLITGAPGVGKTTLAQMIILDFINNGYEHLVIEDKINEAENLLSPDENKKQIIYFDDFLGSNIYEILNPRNNENSLIRFISRVRANPNKLLVLTTRTTILNQALSAYEKLRYRKLHEESKFEIYLDEYSRYHKAEILYNHIYFGNLNDEYRSFIFKDENYFKIIKHDNYNPRLIEYFTNEIHLNEITPENYLNFILENLDNPDEIWRNSYENQIDSEDRFLLNSLFTLRGEATLNSLEQAFNVRIENEAENFGHVVKNDSFNKSIKNLEGSYLKTSYDGKNETVIISFVNPSISDFLINYLKQSNFEKLRLIKGMVFIEQIVNVFDPSFKDYLNFNKTEGKKYYKAILDNENKIKELTSTKRFELEFLKTLLSLFYGIVEEKVIIRLFKKLDLENINGTSIDSFIYVLERISHIYELKEIIIANWNTLILDLYYWADDESRYNSIVSLFEDYSQSYDEFINDSDNNQTVSELLINYLTEIIDQTIIDSVTDYDFEPKTEYTQVGWQEYIEETHGFELRDDIDGIIEDELIKYQDMIFLSDGPFITSSDLNIDTSDLVSRMEEGYLEYQISSAENYYDERPRGNSSYSSNSYNETDRINDLFSE